MTVDGTYNIKQSTPHGERSSKLTLKTDGNSLSGTYEGPQDEQPFSEGTVSGNDVAWSVQMSSPMGEMKLDFKGTVIGDKISGQVQMGSFGSSDFQGTRV